jgi:hypothetical protein
MSKLTTASSKVNEIKHSSLSEYERKRANFRTLLDARWAYFFDEVGIKWEYRPMEINGYIPDFLIECADGVEWLVDVKPFFGDDYMTGVYRVTEEFCNKSTIARLLFFSLPKEIKGEDDCKEAKEISGGLSLICIGKSLYFSTGSNQPGYYFYTVNPNQWNSDVPMVVSPCEAYYNNISKGRPTPVTIGSDEYICDKSDLIELNKKILGFWKKAQDATQFRPDIAPFR